jgi:hypothetical protein
MPSNLGFAERVAMRLGVDPLVIDVSHSPFLSKPRELAELLLTSTTTTSLWPLSSH